LAVTAQAILEAVTEITTSNLEKVLESLFKELVI
jgi:hypothetical protein